VTKRFWDLRNKKGKTAEGGGGDFQNLAESLGEERRSKGLPVKGGNYRRGNELKHGREDPCG